MIKYIIKKEDCKTLLMDIFKLTRYDPYSDTILKKVLPDMISDELIREIQDNKINVTAYSNKFIHSMTVVKKDGWNRFTVTEKFNGEIYNRFDVEYKNNKLKIEEINPDFRRRCSGPYRNMDLILNRISGSYVKRDETVFHVPPKELEEEWKCSSVVTLCHIFAVICYASEYQSREMKKILSATPDQTREITININKYKYVLEEKRKKKAEEINLIRKKKKEDKKKLEEVQKKQVRPEKTSVTELELKKALSDRAKYKALFEEEKKKTEELKERKKEYEREHYELVNLREALKKLATDDEESVNKPSFEKMAEEVRDIKLLIIGGHANWHSRLSEIFTDLTAIGSSEYKSDMNKIYSADLVYFFTNHISHGVYNKALDLMREHDIHYGYINNTNIEQNVAQIYQDYLEGGKNG